ncbi:MAG: hypothetical protein LKJ44_08100 [Bifidobacteriaceae bacterium]|jgi:uncharacterized coiled-coil protein SlyX|nr:hypothetical protein [Bifidobacteriaceae bacterium]MCI1979646.1 hypothetical protein [Bifidobacteriaceae bacterium]
MKTSDIWNYGLGSEGKSGYHNTPAWIHLSYTHYDTSRLWAELGRTDDGGTRDKTKGTIYERICYIDKRVREMSATITAQSVAVETLAKATDENYWRRINEIQEKLDAQADDLKQIKEILKATH